MFALALLGCHPAPPRLPHGPPAPELAVRTSRFVLVASARVEYAASGPPAGVTLDEFVLTAWPDRATRARLAMDGAADLLVEAEDTLAARLATDLDLAWSLDPTPIVITSAGRADDDPVDASTIAAKGACFQGAAFLQCAFTRAVRARQAQSKLLVALNDARAHLDDAGKEATSSLGRDVVVYAVGEALRSVSTTYDPQRHFPVRDPDVLAWLTREWPARVHESAADFGARAAREIALSARARR